MLDALQCFIAVVDHGNLSQAAKALNLSVSSVSRKLDVLETDMCTKLFNRSSRRVVLTDAGTQLLPRAQHILAEMKEAKASVRDLNNAPQGVLSVTAPGPLGRRYIVPAIATFLQKYPLIEIDLHLSDEIVDLSTQRVDVAIRVGALPPSDLVATHLTHNRRIACASPAYLAKHGTPNAPLDLLNHNCLTFGSRSTNVGRWCFAGVNGDKPLPVTGNLRTEDVDAILQAGLEGIGIMHVSEILVQKAVEAGQLVPLFDMKYQVPSAVGYAIHAVRMPGRSHPVKAQLFITHLRDHLSA